MGVVVQAADIAEALTADLEKLGIHAGYVGTWSKKTVLTIQADQLTAVLDLPSVASVSSVVRGITNAGSVVTEGDSILRADDVRSTLGFDGTGVKIGVISDGVASLATSQSNSELPSGVTVNSSLSGSGGEGTALLEIIHDLAPGADLFFSSGINGSIDMEASIDWLISQGVDIIIDDLFFPDQPFFSEGSIADAAQDAVDAGVLYLSAAGNFANNHYPGDFEPSSLDTGSGREFHDFNSGAGDDPFLQVNLEQNASIQVELQWSEAFGSTPSDYSLSLWELDNRA